jgi:hemerythrin-like domain-containing protein
MLQIGQELLAGFDEPVDMLEDCHRRVERFLDALCRVGSESPAELDAQWRALLEGALNYFRDAAPLHTQDEEVSLFPRLRDVADADVAAAALDAIATLEDDHERAQPLHDRLELVGRRWLEAGVIEAEEQLRFAADAAALRDLYRDHIRTEEEVVFTAARSVLTSEQLASVGHEMKVRRHGSV